MLNLGHKLNIQRRFANAGDVYLFVGSDHTKFITEGSGWILKIYQKKVTVTPGTEVTVHTFSGSKVEDETYGQVWQGEAHADAPATATSANFWCGTLGTEVDTWQKYETVYLYVYNPNTIDLVFYFGVSRSSDPTWVNESSATTVKAQSWTKVTIDQLVNLNNVTTAYLNVRKADSSALGEDFIQNGFRLTSIYAISSTESAE